MKKVKIIVIATIVSVTFLLGACGNSTEQEKTGPLTPSDIVMDTE